MTTAIRKHLGDFVALLVLFLIAIGISGYIIANQDARPRIPLIEPKAFTLKAEFSDAQAVTPGQGQSVRVAGVQVGKITKVTLKNGVAVVTMELDPKWKKPLDVKSDATALLRPRTGLKDMFIELDPGGSGRTLQNNDTIPVQNTAPDVDPDEILSAFDTDTRAYLQLLINGAGKGLKGHGTDLNKTFKALGPTYIDLAKVSKAIAARRDALKRLIHNYGDLTNTLADTGPAIRRLVDASDAVFRAFASQNQNISLSVAKLPATLQQTSATLRKVDAYSRILGPTLESLRAPFRQLNVANHAVLPFVKEAEPIVRTKIRPFVIAARPAIRDLRPAAINLAKAAPDLTKSFHELNRFFNMGAYNPNGREPVTGNPVQDKARDEGYLYWLAWVSQNTTSLFSTSDAQGPLRRFIAFFNCTTIRAQLAANPAGASLLGLSNALNDPGLCPNGEGGNTGPGLLGIPNPKTKGGNSAPTKNQTTPGLPNVAPNLPGRPNLPGVPAVPGIPTPSAPQPGDTGSGGSGNTPTVPNSSLPYLLPKGGKP
ncbi:MAG: phospholipid/cholesterol/gamma-HCH transport system substrate-binding protein [Thermoleophilaceae bacterium]|nr:phospholipid/cholesterol/gamma-HCH transport system substrate-binding protein [Thermoleophilaceae bacterium]MEA2435498.1 phospholipid/cholesterol/gamma-HCH transport system substrate-binding protein [Thermoleophilaceae bacterium]